MVLKIGLKSVCLLQVTLLPLHNSPLGGVNHCMKNATFLACKRLLAAAPNEQMI